MNNPTRSRSARLALAAFLIPSILCLVVLAGPAAGQQEDKAAASGQSEELTRNEKKERAKQARIEEYLRKKEERLARKELRQAEKDDARQAVEPASPEPAAVEPAQVGGERVVLPRELARAQELLRQNEIAQDPTVAEYLDLIDRAEASPHQLAAFGNFLADLGMNRLAQEYYKVALSIEREDPTLWINAGTLHRQLGEYSAAQSDYARALRIDPNLAVAHYNLGAVLDELGDYEGAVEEYRIALTLDPGLGDPAINPQAANNERLVAVKLLLYQEKIGNLGLPLVEVPGGELASPGEEGE
jgi:tetratricopeptide (TPR) repeat protein